MGHPAALLNSTTTHIIITDNNPQLSIKIYNEIYFSTPILTFF